MTVARFALLAGLAVAPAHAGEVQFEGFYRARGRAFSSLSIDPSLENAEGASAWAQHRFWLQPRFVASDKVAIYSEIRALDGVSWGSGPQNETWRGLAPGTVDGQLGTVFSDDLRSPSGNIADGLPRGVPDISLWRVWGEVHGATGTWRFGRMPIQWGLGVWQNDGMGLNADFGDSADRVQWEMAYRDIFMRVAGEVNAYGIANNAVRDTASGNVTVAWRGERVEIGVNAQARRMFPSSTDTTSVDGFTLGTASAAFDAEIGNLHIGAEVVSRVGRGGLSTNLPDATVQALGGVAVAQLTTEKLSASVDLGFASGDGDTSDDKLTTFTFDRDYNLGILLFEQPMPLLRDGAGRTLDPTLTGNGISNAFFGRADVRYLLPYDIQAELGVAAARTFKRDEALAAQAIYGAEVNLGARYFATEKLEFVGTSALFIPGNYYTGARTDSLPDGVGGLVFGGQVLARIRF